MDDMAVLSRGTTRPGDAQAPYVGTTAPLIGAAVSLTRKAMTSATASGESACASTSGVSYGRFLAVSRICGATAFTRIPSGRSSRSSTRMRWTKAALETL
jgi:hypothetical protein